jgi:uncharacterized RDD family membrane protein YckC
MLILFFIIIITTFILQQIIIQLELTTLEQVQISAKETITVIPADSLVNLALKNLWVVISFFYFGHYWTKRGQTLGMKVWKIKAVTNDGILMSWGNALKRYVFTLLGLGLFWIIIDKENLALQDRMSQTKLIKI